MHSPSHDNRPSRTVAEFFAGIGLMRLGLEQAGWCVTFANDIDPQKRAMYAAHFGDADAGRYSADDIHALDADDLPTVTLATASFPCNDLSIAGGRAGLAGAHSSAFWGFWRLLRDLGQRRPPLVLLENVVGFLTSHGGADLHAVLCALNELGYGVDAFTLDAARFVPQSRPRLFIVAHLPDRLAAELNRSATVEAQLIAPSPLRPAKLCEFIFAHGDVRWSLRPLPAPPQRRQRLDDILEDLPDDAPQWWSRERAEYFYDQLSDRHRAIADEMIRRPQQSFATAFRRVRKGRSMAELRTDGVAGCLRTPRGGSGRQILFKAGGGRYAVRLLTPRECARLMGADDYRIDASLNQALFGFGDAVCVPAVAWIAREVLNPLWQSWADGDELVAASGESRKEQTSNGATEGTATANGEARRHEGT